MRRGDIGCEVYFVVAGTLRITAAVGRGRRIIFHDIAVGEVFGEHSAIDGHERLADVRALRESLIASMPGEVFRSIVSSHASVRERLLQRLARSVRELTERLLELGAQPVQRRVRNAQRWRGRQPLAPRPRPDTFRGREPRRHCARAGDARAVPPGTARRA